MPSRDETPFTAPGAPSTWKTRGLVTVSTAIAALDYLILRAVVKNAARLYRKKIRNFRENLAADATIWAAKKIVGKEVAKLVGLRLKDLFNILKERRFQESLRAEIRKAYLTEARELWEARLFQNRKADGRKTQRVRTRIPDSGRIVATRGAQLEKTKQEDRDEILRKAVEAERRLNPADD